MLDFNYTLNDSIYRHALKRASESESYIPGKRLIIIGGAAVQLLLGDYGERFRPTDDIDLFSDHYVNYKERKQWSRFLLERFKGDGFPVKRFLCEDWSEVRFEGLASDLFLRLDCFRSYYYLKLREKIEAEFKRGIVGSFEGVKVRFQHPIDIITNKMNRILSSNKVLGIPIKDLRLTQLLVAGRIDDIDTSQHMENLEELVSHRQLNVEDLGRMDPKEVPMYVQGYKTRKDIYDICCVIEASRSKGIGINPGEFRKTLGLMLAYSSAA